MNEKLKVGDFKKYIIETRHDAVLNGIQYIFRFDNCYGASVIKNDVSYGHHADLWELAVLIFDTDGTKLGIDYSTPITDDVLGCLTDDQVKDILDEIKNLECIWER